MENRGRQLSYSVMGDIRFRENTLKGSGGHARFFDRDLKLGKYKGLEIMVKDVPVANLTPTREQRTELRKMRETHHANLTQFFGISLTPRKFYILTEHCQKGTLSEILATRELHLEEVFQASFVTDIIKGMTYLHNHYGYSTYHGNLKSTNCVIDSRWTLKLSSFGLHSLKPAILDITNYMSSQEKLHVDSYAELLWTAPEKLRDLQSVSKLSRPISYHQNTDIYSFGIIMHEIFLRTGPFGGYGYTYSAQEIVDKVNFPGNHGYFRPSLTGLDQSQKYLQDCMRLCWNEDTFSRPHFPAIAHMLRPLRRDQPNFPDNIIRKLEKYTTNLEDLVHEKTEMISREQEKAELILHQILPRYVCLLNDLYSIFDKIIARYDVYKVETIGDAYMVASGLPTRNGLCHAGEIASMSLELLIHIKNFKIRHKPTDQLKLRIGIHSGPCVAGVVGVERPRYCLFGDTVNTASRMESNGKGLKIHMSMDTKVILDHLEGFQSYSRGEIPVKGKGMMETFWLIGDSNRTVESPIPNDSAIPHLVAPPADTTQVLAIRPMITVQPISPPPDKEAEENTFGKFFLKTDSAPSVNVTSSVEVARRPLRARRGTLGTATPDLRALKLLTPETRVEI